jgi:hypothetical protein
VASQDLCGPQRQFAFSCSLTQLDGMSLGSITHTIATEVDVFDGLPELSIIEHRDGPASQLRGAETVSLREG